MIHYKSIAFILQPNDFTYRGGNFYHAGQIMQTHLSYYFINTFLVGVPTARGRQTGVAMGCLVSSEE